MIHVMPGVTAVLVAGIAVLATGTAGTATEADATVRAATTVDKRGDVKLGSSTDQRLYGGVDIRSIRYSQVGDDIVVKVKIQDVRRNTLHPRDPDVVAETNIMLQGRDSSGAVARTGVMLANGEHHTAYGPADPEWGITWSVDRERDYARVVVPLAWLRASLAGEFDADAESSMAQLKASVAWQVIGKGSYETGVPDVRAHDHTPTKTPYIDLAPLP